jgi:hypothetical protein
MVLGMDYMLIDAEKEVEVDFLVSVRILSRRRHY